MAVGLGHVPPSALLQPGQELFEGGGAVAVPARRVSGSPLHDLLLQDLLDSGEGEKPEWFHGSSSVKETAVDRLDKKKNFSLVNPRGAWIDWNILN